MSQVCYGNYKHAVGEVDYKIKRTALEKNKTIYGFNEEWTLDGLLISMTGSESDLKSQIAALQAAYTYGGYDLYVLGVDGRTRTTDQLISSETFSGIQIKVFPSFPEGKGAEYVNYRHYQIVLSADRSILPGVNFYVSFEEKVSFSGGGKQYGFLYPKYGSPIRQGLKRYTSYKATQQGSAVGFIARPAAPPPIWPGALLVAPDKTYSSPIFQGRNFAEYGISWKYEFESVTRLVGFPHRG